MDIQLNHVYRNKKPKPVGSLFHPVYDDRQVIWIGMFELQYDSPTIKTGGKYRKVLIEDFKKWAGENITGTLPEGDWMPYTK